LRNEDGVWFHYLFNWSMEIKKNWQNTYCKSRYKRNVKQRTINEALFLN
jgi:hypothetical protein